MLNATKVKSLLAALTLAIGLQGTLLWGMNELASHGAQQASQTIQSTITAARMPVPAALRQPCPVTLAPVTIVARRQTPLSAPSLAAVEKPAAPELHASEVHCVSNGNA